MSRFTVLAAALWLSACALRPDSAPAPTAGRSDPHSFANTESFVARHLSLDLAVDFAGRSLHGSAMLLLERVDGGAAHLVLDTRDLLIARVEAGDGSRWAETAFTVGPQQGFMGRPLSIAMPAWADRVRVHYRTQPAASGLQWLTPEQTTDKRHPFLYSQSQAIHARSWIPMQDTPQVRITYDAHIRTPPDLLAVMSAENEADAERDGDYHFRMRQPIPVYLVALAVGDLRFRAMSERTGVYAEPSVVDAAAAEFDDTEAMIVATERLYGPYRWGRYDLLILPSSFPYGGMENPRLTFASPTVIAGDKSLVSLVAHELAHSWSGNLVTNATWNDFWLNEGFTNHLTFRIMDEVYGRERGMMERSIGYQSLLKAFEQLPDPRDHTLAPDMAGTDPDEGVTSVPYNRGALFLYNLQHRFGEARFDAFLRQWFDAHAFSSVRTRDFLRFLRERLYEADGVQWPQRWIHAWIHDPALPPDHVVPHSERFAEIDRRVAAWLDGGELADLGAERWSSREWEHFFNTLPGPLDADRMAALDAAFGLTATGNRYVASRWFELGVRSGYAPSWPATVAFLHSVGRMKLITPIYRELAKTDAGRQRARAVFASARDGYHPIAQNAVQRILDAEA